MLSSLGPRPFWKAVQCLACLRFHSAPSVFTTIRCALTVTPSGRNPRAMCHWRSLVLTFTSKSYERIVTTLAYLAAVNNEEGNFIYSFSWNEHWQSFQIWLLLLLQWTWPLYLKAKPKGNTVKYLQTTVLCSPLQCVRFLPKHHWQNSRESRPA